MKKLSFLAIFLAATLFGMAQKPVNQPRNERSGALVVMETNYGKITLRLYNETPRHRDNFLAVAQSPLDFLRKRY